MTFPAVRVPHDVIWAFGGGLTYSQAGEGVTFIRLMRGCISTATQVMHRPERYPQNRHRVLTGRFMCAPRMPNL